MTEEKKLPRNHLVSVLAIELFVISLGVLLVHLF